MARAQIVAIVLLLVSAAVALLMPRLLSIPVPRRKQLVPYLLYSPSIERDAQRYWNVVFGTLLVGIVVSLIIVTSVF